MAGEADTGLERLSALTAAGATAHGVGGVAPAGAGGVTLASGRGARASRAFEQPIGRRLKERLIELLLMLAAASSVLITLGIVGVLLYESSTFFSHVSVGSFLTDTQWTPLFEDAHYGILPLLCGTLTVTLVALIVAVPLGTISAIWLNEYAPHRVREVVKPVLELLGAVPTVVYGYFALLFVTPLLQKLVPGLPGFNMLSAGLVIGIMIIPYVSSLSEDAMHAVPMNIREGSYAMGATRMQTALRVVVPSAFSGITAAYILGISRALGETMVVAIAAGMQPNFTLNPKEPAATITAYIVQVSLGDLAHGSIGYQSIFAAGLALMLMTLVFNIGGYVLRKRYREVA
jgi:phosphate transport system permease protein